MTTNRREFLQRSGGLALTGLSGGTGIASAATPAVSQKPQSPSKATASHEGWLDSSVAPGI
jgi:hypothetical protein